MNWDKIAKDATAIIEAAAPVLEVAAGILAPGASQAFHIVEKIVQAAVAAEPTAVSLYNRMKTGEVPSQDELKQFSMEYEASYQRLKAAASER